MLGEESRLDVHAAIVTRRLLAVAGLAIEGPAVEELLEPRAFPIIQMDEVARQRLAFTAAVALANVVLVQKRCVMVVNSLGHDAGPSAERTGHPQLGHDRLADKCALIGQLVQKMSQFFFGFEGDNLRFRGASGHKLGTIFVGLAVFDYTPREAVSGEHLSIHQSPQHLYCRLPLRIVLRIVDR